VGAHVLGDASCGASGGGRNSLGWKVLRGFQPDGAVLELYTGLVLKTGRQPAFAPETNLTLASSTLHSSLPLLLSTLLPTLLYLAALLLSASDFDLRDRPSLNVIHIMW